MSIPSLKRFLLMAGLTLTIATLQAQTYVEAVDAGQTLPTAASTGVVGIPLMSITGTLNPYTDADLFAITITNTTTFSAIASSIAGVDTSLFLFNSSGVPVIANDDSSNTSLQAAIPAGNSLLTSLSPGTYFIGISLSGNEPVNLNNQKLFTTDQPTTIIRGMASGLNPKTESNFNGNTSFQETGDYTITFASTQEAMNPFAVPEPSSVIMLLLGVGGVAFIRRLRARSQRSTLNADLSVSPL